MKRYPLYSIVLSLVGTLLVGTWSCAQGGRVAYTDPSEAGPDYLIQGEYLGRLNGGARLGAQVIALGGGAFRAVLLPGGLPGDGWDGKTRIALEGRTDGEETRLETTADGWRGRIVAGKLEGTTPEGKTFRLRRVVRKSPTLGQKPPRGAVVLFDGTSVDAWQSGRMTPAGFLQVGTRSKQAFQDFRLHLEFRTPFMPNSRGQGRGNSGVYLQERYEVQILDSFGLEGKHNECGGLYLHKDPDVNMCFPPLQWQTYDIDFQAARYDAKGNKIKNAIITVRHNGVVVHDRFEIPGPSRSGKPETPEPGAIHLQNHRDPVQFRNIWIVEK